MSSQIRFGFLGAGAIAGPSAEIIASHPHGAVVAAQDTNFDRLATLCRDHAIPKAYATADELFADDKVDVVYIAVPNAFHIPLALGALAAGKHVMLEKPFALNAVEAQQAVDAARAAGKVLTVGMNQRFAAPSQRYRAFVQAGKFGPIYHAKAYWRRRTGIPKLGTWFGSKDLAGGGCLYDIGVHVLDLCLWVMGNFEPVSAFGSTYTKFGDRGLGEGGWGMSTQASIPFEVEDFATGLIRFANGATVQLDATWACHAAEGNVVDVELFGPDAGGRVYGEKIFRYSPSGDGYEIIDSPAGPGVFNHNDRFHNLINHLRGEEPLCVTTDQALAVQRILDALADSSRTGRSVDLQTPPTTP